MPVAPATSPTYSEIEVIVRAVLQRLQKLEAAPVASVAHTAVAAAQATIPSTSSTVVRLDQPLVTLADLRDRWGTMQSLEVPPRCIVTPAVHDELRQQGVKLQRFDPQTAAAGAWPGATLPSQFLLLLPATGKSEVKTQFKAAEANVALLADDCSLALKALEEHLDGSPRFAIWSSPRPFAALRAAAGVSIAAAVQLSRLEELPQAIEQAQPNLLILDDRRWTASGIANLTRSWISLERKRSAVR